MISLLSACWVHKGLENQQSCLHLLETTEKSMYSSCFATKKHNQGCSQFANRWQATYQWSLQLASSWPNYEKHGPVACKQLVSRLPTECIPGSWFDYYDV